MAMAVRSKVLKEIFIHAIKNHNFFEYYQQKVKKTTAKKCK